MSAHTIKKSSGSAALFILIYQWAGFLPLAGIIMALFLYLIVSRPLIPATLKAAGIPFLFAVFLIALVSTLTSNAFPFSAWNVAKDGYFFIAPVLLLVTGLTFLRSEADVTHLFQTAIYVLTLTSIIAYSDFLFGGAITNVSLQSRYTYALNSGPSTLALLLILSLHPTLSSLHRDKKAPSLLVFNLLLIIVSLSRINMAISLISLIFIYSRSRLAPLLSFAIVLLLTVLQLLEIMPSLTMREASSQASFFDKLLGSFAEFRLSNYSSMSDINDNWRGYEAYLGTQVVEQAGPIARLIGVGFGSYAEGPFDDKLQNIPFFHNGFVTIYLKAGFLGLIAFALFIFKLYRLAGAANREGRRTGDPRIKRAAVTIVLMTNAILLQTLATHGVYYSKTTLGLFFIGLAFYSLQFARQDLVANGRSDVRSGT